MTGAGTRGSAAAKPTLIFQGCIPAAFRVWIVTCLNTNRIPNVPKLFHALEQAWGGWMWVDFLSFFLCFHLFFILCDFVMMELSVDIQALPFFP